VAEVGLMLRVSARTAAARVDTAQSLCGRLPGTLAALDNGRITLAQARLLNTETLNLSDQHTAQVEQQVLAKAPKQPAGQSRAATRRAVLSTDPSAAQQRTEQAKRERLWPESDGMAMLSAYLPAADAVGVYAVLDEYARRSGGAGDEREMDARRADALVDLALNPTGYASTAARHRTAAGSAHTGGLSEHPGAATAAVAPAGAAAAVVAWTCASTAAANRPGTGSDSPRIRSGCTPALLIALRTRTSPPRRPACGHHYTNRDQPEVGRVVGVHRSHPASKRTSPET
jgi:hypothetical protein